MIWTAVRVVLIVLALAVAFVTVLFVEGPSGRTLDPSGVVIDLIALAVIVVCVWSLWNDRRRRA